MGLNKHQFLIDFPLFIIQYTAEWRAIILEADTRNRENLLEENEILRQPTPILAWAQDRVMPFVLTEKLAKKIPNMELRIFSDAALLLFLEKARAVNQAIVEILTSA